MSGLAQFVSLFDALDGTTSTNAKREALAKYVRAAAPADAVWAIYFLTGRRMRRSVSGRVLREWAAVHSGLPTWLVEESYHAVGDLAETLAILCARGGKIGGMVGDQIGGLMSDQIGGMVGDQIGGLVGGQVGDRVGAVDSPDQAPAGDEPILTLADFVEREIVPLGAESLAQQRVRVTGWWERFDERTCFVVHKLITGGFRVGVSATLVAKALAAVLELEPGAIEHRLMGNWLPSPEFAARLFAASDASGERSRPYPFYLASSIEHEPAALGEASEWLAEWKWDGIRAQVIVRGGEMFIWSRGEELLTDRFPELILALRTLPNGTVLDGEIVPWRNEQVLPFAVLQTRITRKRLTSKILRDAPVVLLAFDLLEFGGRDVRGEALWQRRAWLHEVLGDREGTLRVSPEVGGASWEVWARQRGEARARGVEGLMLKRRSSPYRVGRPRGDWWKWKVDPFTMDAVLVYAQAGHGRRAALYTDYTFAVWDGDVLVPVAKAYSGLSDAEVTTLDAWIRANTTERFGPVRGVSPHHVFELGFEGIQRSPRHKSGVAMRFPRILRWRTDKGVRDAGTLAELHALIDSNSRAQTPVAPPETPIELPLFAARKNAADRA